MRPSRLILAIATLVVSWLVAGSAQAQSGYFYLDRAQISGAPDDGFMVRRDFVRGIGKLRAYDLVYDLLVFPKQLPAAIEYNTVDI